MYGLGLADGVSNRDCSRVASDDLRLESNCQRATAPRSQARTTIIGLRIVASNLIAREPYRRCVWVAGIVEKRDCQRGCDLAQRLNPEIQSGTWRHSEGARHVGRQLHWKTTAIDFAVRRCGAGALQSVQLQEIVEARYQGSAWLRRETDLKGARSLRRKQTACASIPRDLEVWQSAGQIAVAQVIDCRNVIDIGRNLLLVYLQSRNRPGQQRPWKLKSAFDRVHTGLTECRQNLDRGTTLIGE